MKAKITRGMGFRGVLDYALDTGNQKGKNPEIVGGTLTVGNARAMSAQFAVTRRLRPDIKAPVWHASLALPIGERLSSDKWSSIADEFMQAMGFPSDSLYTVIRHNDTQYDHVHIIASRISLSGALWHGQWEVYRAIKATQTLERIHDLILTPGLGEPKDEKSLTKNEIEMALCTGEEPPRQRLQRLVKEAAQGRPTAVMFAERLALAGVGVRFQIQKTGITGVSYEIDGIAFKGQSLGDAYKWSKFSKKQAVSYEQARDSEGIRQFTTAIADRARGDKLGDSSTHLENDTGIATTNHRGADDPSTGTPDLVEGGSNTSPDRLRHSDSSAAPGTGRADAGDDRQSSAGIRAEGGEAESDHLDFVAASAGTEIKHRQDDENRPPDRIDTPETRRITSANDYSGRGTDADGTTDAATKVENSTGADSGRDGQRSGSSDWSRRFREASAAKRRTAERGMGGSRLGERNARRASVADEDRQSAREIDPSSYLKTMGFAVKKQGRHVSVSLNGDETYRGTLKPDGHFVWCDRYENGIGHNIDLVNEIEPGSGYATAVYRLLGAPSVNPNLQRAAPKRQPPRLPEQAVANRLSGRAYLGNERGISKDTLDHAEACGMLRYADGGVLFVGYDAKGTPQSITRRATELADPIQKRDFARSDKSYAPILSGDPSTVWIVEGGVDALALHDLAKRQEQPSPTVIVSGGANVRSFLDNPFIQMIIRAAKRIFIAMEREKDAATQAKTDAAHEQQAQRVEEITGIRPLIWQPKKDKDLADMNHRQQKPQPVRLMRDAIKQSTVKLPSTVMKDDFTQG
ncbi:Relaxase/mobilization nuclease family protein [Halothiobacillus neapolitanus c2]|uniref:Relaxase/mobilization nuclease family protein n=2 Tax=Halothiobacillus neapolitanus TaxID=927 RepID=D0KXQ1_HALNC|nr:Relaxase/mobilization nuclease family protein [Halothiobacillus neapolitanus c2]TDN57676.1 relaxase/mobilization nuclease-like protein [Halothiobacillus neapolitanus]